MVGQTWPEDWDDRRRGVGCALCAEGRPDENEWGVRVFAGDVADAYLQRETPARGYTVVVFRGRHAADLTELTDDEVGAFWREVATVARAVEAVFRPCHLNHQALGNRTPHVHVHVVPRYADDPSPERPLGEDAWAAARRLDAADLSRQVAALRRALNA